MELYQKACDVNSALGCSNLGVMYENGDGVRQDKSKALNLYWKACDLKHQRGCENYAKLKNNGVKQQTQKYARAIENYCMIFQL